ncbi:hypothetical protein BDN72DRAFT_737851, partial [Pluteus cervinus]
KVGDPIGAYSSRILDDSAPYPGDSTDSIIKPFGRFWVFRHNATEHVVLDTFRNASWYIETSLIEHPHFSVVRWYADRCSELEGLP